MYIERNRTVSNVECSDASVGVDYQDKTVSEGQVETATAKTKQFNFARHWRQKIAGFVDDPDVIEALTWGMRMYDGEYHKGDPPWQFGRGPLNGQIARRGCLSWYQPLGRCHFIAPFSWAVGRRIFPKLQWGFITSDSHTVVIGWSDDWHEPEWVMDILLFREMNAQKSLEFAKSDGWRFYRSLTRYLASFCNDPEAAYTIVSDRLSPALIADHTSRN
jgi:hypothetical protein